MVVFAKPSIGSVIGYESDGGGAGDASGYRELGVAIEKCVLWVDLGEVGEMTVAGGVASLVYV